ncbi:MAG: Ni/Fe-hydrogenase cytochrome b subunit [Gammaproteobacteria bacterium]|nr:MAG: Ni/Fe-hydrogenase cytochrome b subunit [Gammaproteobacteria bacterium]
MSEHHHNPLGGRLLNWPLLFFAPFAMLGIFVIFHRLIFGIGAVTDLNGGYPWGLWIAFDLLVGTGFACGGWALAWTVYVFNQGQYHALVRPALLASLFGYSLGGLSIVMDVGRWWNLPYFYIPGFFNTNSVLFETATCMTIYVGVVAIEFAPVILEKFGWHVPLRTLNRIMFAVIALGALLPTMHQSSMGSLFIAAGDKIHEETPLLYQLTKVIDVFLMIFLSVRFGELFLTNKVEYLVTGNLLCFLFWLETFLLMFPLLVFHWDKLRRDARFLFLGALSMLAGAALWRMNLSLFAYNPGGGFHYFPKTEEVLLSVGLVAIEISGYLLIIKLMPVLPTLTKSQFNLQRAHNGGEK